MESTDYSVIFGTPRRRRLSHRYDIATGEDGALGRPCCSVAAVTDGYVKVNNRFRRSSNRNRCCVAVVDFYVYSRFLEFLVLTRVPRVVTSLLLSFSSPISHPSATAPVVRQHIQPSIAGKPTKMSVNNVQALFACSRCFSRHPFEDLSPGQQLCKVRAPRAIVRFSDITRFPRCRIDATDPWRSIEFQDFSCRSKLLYNKV